MHLVRETLMINVVTLLNFNVTSKPLLLLICWRHCVKRKELTRLSAIAY